MQFHRCKSLHLPPVLVKSNCVVKLNSSLIFGLEGGRKENVRVGMKQNSYYLCCYIVCKVTWWIAQNIFFYIVSYFINYDSWLELTVLMVLSKLQCEVSWLQSSSFSSWWLFLIRQGLGLTSRAAVSELWPLLTQRTLTYGCADSQGRVVQAQR